MNNKLRCHQWFYGANETGLLHKGALRATGIDRDDYHSQPVIGIANNGSELNNCNMSLRTGAEAVKKGIREAGGITTGVSGDITGRIINETHSGFVPESIVNGRGRKFALVPDRWCGTAGQLQ